MRVPLRRRQAQRLSQSPSRPNRVRKPRALRAGRFLSAALLFLIAFVDARAGDDVQAAGDLLQFAIPAIAAGLTLGYRDGEGAVELVESGALTLGTTYVLKYAVDERRPNGGRQSFPSAHTSISFSGAEFMRERYGWQYGIPAYAAASFVAYSRVEAREHHPHDVIAGAAIGILSSYIFTKPYKGWHLQAESDGRFFGFRIHREF